MDEPDRTSRFDRCRCVIGAVPEAARAGAVPTPIPYRRCPVGVIADVDCPEYVGARCNSFVDRGLQPPTTVPRTEVPLLAAELALDYLTPRYHRRVAALRGVVPPVEADRSAPSLGAAGRRDLSAGGPINVPADRVPRSP